MVFGFFTGPVDAAADRALAAVAAALDGRDRVHRLESEVHRELRLSVAVHTGVIERRGAPDALLGEPNDMIATTARLWGHATPTGVMISGPTFDLLADQVVAESIGQLRLRRLPEPVETWRVDAVRRQL